jgi:hypothetical protein
MAKAESALETLKRRGGDKTSGVFLESGAGATAIREMQADAKRDLGEPVPEEYVEFLKLTNGAQLNGAYFKSAENLVAENLDVPRSEIIVLGNEGNMVEFVFDRRDEKFHTIAMGFHDDIRSSFDSFQDMLLTVMKEQDVL